jgi:uncharacterized protein (TIGR04255 family)
LSWLGQREVPDVILGNPPLTEVICQLRYPPVLRLQHDLQLVAAIQDGLRDSYPKLEAQAMISLAVPSELAEAPRASVAGRTWRLTDDAGTWVVAIAADFVALSTHAYQHWEDFAERLEVVFRTVREAARINTATRLGLRYTNQVSLPTEEGLWPQIIEPELLGWVADLGNDYSLQSSLQEARLRADSCRVGFRHGILPVSEAGARQAYLLDIDCYTEGLTSADPAALLAQAKEFNRVANRFFFNAVTPDGLKQFAPRAKEK